MNIRPLCLAITLGCFPVYPVVADPSQQEEVVVTATRTPIALADSLASVSTISRSDFDVKQPLDVTDALSEVAGLDFSRSGGAGAATSLYTRGTSNGHTLVLVDGQRISNATLGNTNFQFLNPDQIERIEIVRGAQSALYGSEAIGGVIQVFTRDGTGEPNSYVSATAGANELRKFAAGGSGNTGSWRYGVHVSHLETEGIDNLEDDTGFNSDLDGYRNRALGASLGYEFGNGLDVALRFLENDSRNEFDSAFSPATRPYTDSRLQNINLRAELPVTENWRSELSVGRSVDDMDDFDSTTGLNTNNFRTTREQIFWQNDFSLAKDQVLTVGYDYYDDQVDSSSNEYTDAEGKAVGSRDNSALFAQYQGYWALVDLVAGVREDDNEEFGSQSTGNLALGVSLGDRHKVVVSWAEGFKAPTFNDLYWPAGPFSAGNPDLQPEQSENLEVSFRGSYDVWSWSLSYFENDVENLINWTAGPDFVWRPYNVNDAEISGAEVMVSVDLSGWALDASYTHLDPRDAESGKLLPKRARKNLTLDASREFGALLFGFAVKSQGRRYDDAFNTRSVAGYATLDVRLGYQISDHFETVLRIENLFDRDYQLNRGYNQDGRSWQLGLTYRL